jgi:hypothetical protein
MKQKLQEGIDFYFDDLGFMVLSEAFHLKNGKCCGNGCKHCPYQYINVPEPRKSEILDKSKCNLQLRTKN